MIYLASNAHVYVGKAFTTYHVCVLASKDSLYKLKRTVAHAHAAGKLRVWTSAHILITNKSFRARANSLCVHTYTQTLLLSQFIRQKLKSACARYITTMGFHVWKKKIRKDKWSALKPLCACACPRKCMCGNLCVSASAIIALTISHAELMRSHKREQHSEFWAQCANRDLSTRSRQKSALIVWISLWALWTGQPHSIDTRGKKWGKEVLSERYRDVARTFTQP